MKQRAAHDSVSTLRAGMTTTLARVKAAAEQG